MTWKSMLLRKRKSAKRGLISAIKARRRASDAGSPRASAIEHEKQLAVVDAVEWAVERWASWDLVEPSATDPRPAHAARLIAALVYLDARFQRLDPAFVTRIIEDVAGPRPAEPGRSRLDAKAAALLLTVEVRAFSR
jgi:hypothetical protein